LARFCIEKSHQIIAGMIVASVSRSAAAVGRTSGFGQIAGWSDNENSSSRVRIASRKRRASLAVCSGDIFDHPDVDPWIFKPCSSALSPASKMLIPLTVLPFDLDQARVLFATEAAMPTPSPRSPTISPRIG
jgi:hypothetical protein